MIFVGVGVDGPGMYQAFKKSAISPGQVAQLVGALPHALKDQGFDSWSGHTPRL